MIDSIVSEIVPPGYDYSGSWWFSSIQKKELSYRNHLLRISLVVASVIPFMFVIRGFLAHYYLNAALCLFPAAFFLFLFIYFWKTGDERRVIPAVLFACVISFFLLFFLPGSSDVYMILYFFFPLFAHRVRGSFRGTLWIGAGFIIGSVLGLMYYSGVIHLNIEMNSRQHIIIAVAYCILIGLSYILQRQHERYVRDLVEKIMYDEVTGLPNKSVLQQTLSHPGRKMFVILRIEKFGDLGTMFGFSLSEAIISTVAHRLAVEREKYGYYVYRLKDNDFGLLFVHPASAVEKNESVLLTLCEEIASQPMVWDNKDFDIKICAGGILVDESVTSGIIHKADAALKVAESLHKTSIVFSAFSESLSMSEKDDIYQVLLRNRLNHEFKSYFQPVLNSLDGAIMWYECLLRIKDANGRYQGPLPYLQVAQTTGIDQYIAKFMIEEACFAIIRTGYSFSVNLTGADLMRDELITDICRKMEEIRLLDGTLIIECSGSEIEKNSLCVGNLARLRIAGCQIAIDDFGAGFNNFVNLLKIDADFVKIDGTLVMQSAHDERAEYLLKGITKICQQAGKKVVAEYVENESIAINMKKLGIDCLQGFYCGYPVERIA